MNDISEIIENGLVFKAGARTGSGKKNAVEKVKTKAKKKKYITGKHGSGAAKMKAEYRRKRAEKSRRKIEAAKGK